MASSECDEFYEDGQPPIIFSTHDFGDVQEFCYTHFAVVHSTATRGAIWSVQSLTRENALLGDCISRPDVGFHQQDGLGSDNGASASDYTRSGWQIGHMTPVDDMPDFDTQRQTFVFSNAVPQAPRLNSPRWSGLENQIHNMAEDVPDGLYVVTGPIYADENIRMLNGRVGIPTHVFKAVYDPAGNRARVFIAANRNTATILQMSLAELEREYGIVAFPTLSSEVRSQEEQWTLPRRQHRRCVLR
ncbi:MAG: DNA/RNA non-specific endonuclease [Hyphomonadaceae bacterium]|nr:DNA/RNA non-specific endonuclease [Hyphomonadaceae bacterium]